MCFNKLYKKKSVFQTWMLLVCSTGLRLNSLYILLIGLIYDLWQQDVLFQDLFEINIFI